jgi:hypothetical protein
VILDKGRVAASGTLAELLGRREAPLRLAAVDGRAEGRLRAAGSLTSTGDGFTVALRANDDGVTVLGVVRDLVGLGVQGDPPSRCASAPRSACSATCVTRPATRSPADDRADRRRAYAAGGAERLATARSDESRARLTLSIAPA